MIGLGGTFQGLQAVRRAAGRHLAAAVTLAAMAAGLSCDESLPPREAPPEIFSRAVDIVNSGRVIIVRNGRPAGTQGAFRLQVINMYDEVVQDSAVLEGRVEIWLKSNPEVRTEFRLGPGDLVTYDLLNRGTLTIPVNDTLIMQRQWSHGTLDGIPFWDYLELTPGVTMSGEPYCISDPVPFVLRCSLRIFKSYGQVQFRDQEVLLTYQVFGIACQSPTE